MAGNKPIDPDMQEMLNRADAYSKAYRDLENLVADVNEQIARVTADNAAVLQEAAGRAAGAKANLAIAVDRRRDLFEKPKTRTVNGVRFGLLSQRGSITYDCTDDTMAERIISVLGDDDANGFFIKTETTIDKMLLRSLDDEKLRKLGVEIHGDVVKVFVKPAKGNAEKIVEALLESSKGVGR